MANPNILSPEDRLTPEDLTELNTEEDALRMLAIENQELEADGKPDAHSEAIAALEGRLETIRKSRVN
ncbi:MAG: hypothetical protein Q7K39_03730 [Candidatus Magasanikbacteria bacterium]|nr:hypothetical protein [Candidatus Magasanikbacteria bacterium]